jgi:hypothetical protein
VTPESVDGADCVDGADPVASADARRDRLLLAGLLVVGSLLLFARLDDRVLWQDEAETALLARSIAEHGIPWAQDGDLLVSSDPVAHREFNAPDYAWRWTPWLQFYLASGSFAVLGESAFSARLPFALLGLGCIVLVFRLGAMLTRNSLGGVAAALLLLTSVEFLLYSRQCRYYAPLCFFTLLLFHEYERSLRGGRHSVAGLIAAATGLIQSHYPAAACLIGSVGLHFALFGRGIAPLRPMLLAALGASVLAIPTLILIAPNLGNLGGAGRNLDVVSHLWIAADQLNRFALPGAVAALGLGFAAITRLNPISEPPRPSSLTAMGIAFASAPLVLAATMPDYFFRYYIMLVPIGAVVQAFVVVRVADWHRPAAVALLALLCATDLATRLVPGPTYGESLQNLKTGDESSAQVVGDWAAYFPMAAYLYEISHDITGPLEEIAKFLNANAKPDDIVLATYGDLPLRFHTGLTVVGGAAGEALEPFGPPDWLIRRPHTIPRDDVRAFLRDQSLRFQRIQLGEGVAELPWEHRPAPGYHKFRTARKGPPVEIGRRLVP